ncbi:MAG: response regulator [Nitrospira sp.]|nr:response regulator [Nitrospira sp.]
MSITQEQPVLFLVEDEEDTSNLIKLIMETEGYHVVHAADGHQACQLINALTPPALALLDLGLPKASGLQVLAHIIGRPAWRHVPVIMLTADSSEHTVRQVLQLGAKDYILKPFKKEVLLARLQRFHKSPRQTETR